MGIALERNAQCHERSLLDVILLNKEIAQLP